MKEAREIICFLGEGRENARSAAELAAVLGVDERQVRKVMNAARNDGALICSGVPGYWLPGDPAELWETYTRVSRQADSSMKAMESIRRKLMEEEGGSDGMDSET